jgi:hypothetical protein
VVWLDRALQMLPIGHLRQGAYGAHIDGNEARNPRVRGARNELILRGSLALSQRTDRVPAHRRRRQEVAMERVKNEPSRGPLGAIGNILAGGGQALIGQAQSLAGDVQRRIADVVPPVLSGQLERLDGRVRSLEALLASGGREIVGPVRALALNAIESAAALRARLDDLLERLERLEHRVGELDARRDEH